MHPNAELIHRFYTAFQARDAATMGGCYAPEVRFSDPAFGELRGDRARAMWTMLCQQAKDLRIEFSGVEADDTTGRAHWEAWYPFGPAARPVHNVIDATFRFADGRIVEHDDQFDFYRWAKQGLGVPGLLLGWSGWMQGQVRAQANKGLDKFLAKGGA